jgi:hypothetical protein
VDPQRLIQRPVERGTVVAKLLPEPLLRLSLDEVGRRGVGVLPLQLQARRGSNARRRGPGAVRWAPQRRAKATPGHERPRRGLGGRYKCARPLVPARRRDVVVVGDLHHRRSWAAGCGGQRRSWRRGDRHGATVIDAASCGSTSVAGCCGSATAAACCAFAASGSGTVVVTAGRGSVASASLCEPPLAAVAVLAAARDILDERLLMGMVVSVLSTLAGMREGMVSATLQTQRQET